jgi:hypothetical protein
VLKRSRIINVIYDTISKGVPLKPSLIPFINIYKPSIIFPPIAMI